MTVGRDSVEPNFNKVHCVETTQPALETSALPRKGAARVGSRNWQQRQLFLHDDRCALVGSVKETLRHPFRDANAAMRSGKGRDIALVHGVTAIEMHAVRHLSSLKMAPFRPAIFPDIDVSFHDMPIAVDVIAKFARDVVPLLRNDVIMTRRSSKSGLAGRHGRFSDQYFSFVKIGFLLAQMNHDLGRPGYIVAMPVTSGRARLNRAFDGLLGLLELLAAREKEEAGRNGEKLGYPAGNHGAADINVEPPECNPNSEEKKPSGTSGPLSGLRDGLVAAQVAPGIPIPVHDVLLGSHQVSLRLIGWRLLLGRLPASNLAAFRITLGVLVRLTAAQGEREAKQEDRGKLSHRRIISLGSR